MWRELNTFSWWWSGSYIAVVRVCRVAAVLCGCYQETSNSLKSMKWCIPSLFLLQRGVRIALEQCCLTPVPHRICLMSLPVLKTAKKTYTEKRISTTCADPLMLSKETLGSTEEKGMPDLIDNVSWNNLIKMFLLACRCTEIC